MPSSSQQQESLPFSEADKPWLILRKEVGQIGYPVGGKWKIRQALVVPDGDRKAETVETIGPSDVKQLAEPETPPA